jgi:murein DD-endopeptidase MepM/ murein hydrolase activator NlpD
VRRFVLICVSFLAVASPAWAHTDGGRQLELHWPAQGTVTSPFGHDGYRWHPGVDIGILRSLRVSAAAPGRVIETGEPAGFSGYGRVVQVDMGDGWTALYAHLDRPLVRVGAVVTTGQELGIAGCTGWCTGTHLHFELRRLGVPTNPFALGFER